MESPISTMRMTLVAVAAIGITGCASSLKSTVTTADDADLGTFKTYAWVPGLQLNTDTNSPTLVNPITGDRVRASIDNELQRKGYRRVPLQEADLAVAFTLGARDQVRVRNEFNSLGYRYSGFYPGFNRFSRFGRFGRFGRGFAPYTTTVSTFKEGTLVVDVFDNQRREALWHGAATKRISKKDNGEQLISEAVSTLLNQFPDRPMMSEMMEEMKDGALTS